MTNYIALNPQQMELFVSAIEASMLINSRSGFFLWAQGALQAFVPHETLLCVHGDIARMRFMYESFSGGVPDAATTPRLDDLVGSVLPRMVDDWQAGGCVPRLFCADEADLTGRRQLMADLARRNFGRTLAHGPREIAGDQGSFFVFLQMPRQLTGYEGHALNLLTPFMHLALHRMLTREQVGQATSEPEKIMLSKREIQVLYWVKNGKTNEEIGRILDITPPTAKNHVQKILRKLNVKNRAEAAGKGVALRLFSPDQVV